MPHLDAQRSKRRYAPVIPSPKTRRIERLFFPGGKKRRCRSFFPERSGLRENVAVRRFAPKALKMRLFSINMRLCRRDVTSFHERSGEALRAARCFFPAKSRFFPVFGLRSKQSGAEGVAGSPQCMNKMNGPSPDLYASSGAERSGKGEGAQSEATF
jgi:hypothetical protein